MVSPVNVTTDMVTKCAGEKFAEKYAEECSSIVEKSFPVFIDYDIDSYVSDGCHGSDTFFDDGPIVWQFSKYVNGDIVVKGMVDDYIIPANGESAGKATVIGGGQITGLPKGAEGAAKSFNIGNCSFYYVDLSFYNCYKDSQSLNSALDDEAKAIVEKFFMGIMTQMLDDFDPAWQWKQEMTQPEKSE